MPVFAQWKVFLLEAVKGVVLLMIMERLYLTPHASWLEVRML